MEPDDEVLAGLVDISELCRQLRCKSHQTVSNYVAQGMPYLRLGKRRLFAIAAVRAWIRSKQVDMTPRLPGRPAPRARRRVTRDAE